MTDIKQELNIPEQNTAEHLSQNNRFKQRSPSYKSKDHLREEQRKINQQVGKSKEIMCEGNLHEIVSKKNLGEFFGLGTTNYLKDNCSSKMSRFQQNRRHKGHVCDKLVNDVAWDFTAAIL